MKVSEQRKLSFFKKHIFNKLSNKFKMSYKSLSNLHKGVCETLEPWHNAVVNSADNNSTPLYYLSLENKTLITALMVCINTPSSQMMMHCSSPPMKLELLNNWTIYLKPEAKKNESA